ncbi:DeoR/GlpR family DNA-binding transcription regulator [Streptomyces naphthomycinicus]|uniref:DeoR/GlpR family DNA-binding transcription regulator n=1 Tax=Streptomyces naphthomycinicus TaxID=2872625 RepID=UPI001CED7057|nr:DeoR/GlpR family DNA-binding transcription regulator [Streptomyces sp. TML10]
MAGADARTDAREERRNRLRALVTDKGFVRTADLATEFGVSVMTVHRDLDALQAQGWLRKVRGGASCLPSTQFHGSTSERLTTMVRTKQLLARAAAEELAPGQVVMIDDSTTCLNLVRHLPEHTPVTVVSNSLPAISALAREPGVSLVALGGTYFPAYDAFLGAHTARSVEAFRADVLFMSTTAVTGGRCYHMSPETVQVKQAMMAAASRRVLIIDHTKFANQGLYALAPLSDFDLVLVDDAAPAGELRRLRDNGVRVRTVTGAPGAPRPHGAA